MDGADRPALALLCARTSGLGSGGGRLDVRVTEARRSYGPRRAALGSVATDELRPRQLDREKHESRPSPAAAPRSQGITLKLKLCHQTPVARWRADAYAARPHVHPEARVSPPLECWPT